MGERSERTFHIKSELKFLRVRVPADSSRTKRHHCGVLATKLAVYDACDDASSHLPCSTTRGRAMDDLDDLDVEVLDDELLGTPGKDLPAPRARRRRRSPRPTPHVLASAAKAAATRASASHRRREAARGAARALEPVRGGSGASAPTAGALGARAKAEASQSDAAPARVTGSLMGTGDDTSSSDEDSAIRDGGRHRRPAAGGGGAPCEDRSRPTV